MRRELDWKYSVYLCISTAVVLLLMEGFLRLFGYPQGLFMTRYPKRQTLNMLWGAIPYTVRTNSIGLRGEEISEYKRPGVARILALGDSVTDGFFVDNEETYPAQLKEYLERETGKPVDVVNAGLGNISIDQEFLVLRNLAPMLEPDVVVLTFVTNDIAGIEGKSREGLVRLRAHPKALIKWILANTAIGEFVFDFFLRASFESYRASERNLAAAKSEDRYSIAGGDDFIANSETFLKRFPTTDGLLLKDEFADGTKALIDHYVYALKHLGNYCKERGIELIYVYFPAYPQIYLKDSPMAIRDILSQACREEAIAFVDLTGPFREEGAGRVLHLAPLDYHLNPAGNRLMARVIGSRLLRDRYLEKIDN